jgi:hypothetical protein
MLLIAGETPISPAISCAPLNRIDAVWAETREAVRP